MTLAETLAALAIALFVVGLGIVFWMNLSEEQILDAEFMRVRGHAVDFARVRCTSPPATAEPLTGVLTAIGATSEGISDPSLWSVRLTARPGGAGVIIDVLYRTPPDSRASRVILRKPGARLQGGFVEIPVIRKPTTANRSGFRYLMSDVAC